MMSLVPHCPRGLPFARVTLTQPEARGGTDRPRCKWSGLIRGGLDDSSFVAPRPKSS